MLGEDAKWASVSLRLFGDDLPLDSIGTRLDLAPYRVGRKGEHIQDNPRYAKHKSDLWIWSVASMHKVPLENQLALTLDVLEPRRERLSGVLGETGARADLFIGFGSGNGQGRTTFTPDLLDRLARLGLPLEFDLYPPTVDKSYE